MDFSLGLVEVSSLGNAIAMLDEMLKVADVEFVAVERKLGGRLVTIVVRGSISSVTASVETGKRFAKNLGCLKAAEVIARPHSEILKFIHLDEELEITPNTQSAATHTGSLVKETPEKISVDKKTAPKATAKKTKEAEKSAKTTKSKAETASDIKTAPKKRGTKKQ